MIKWVEKNVPDQTGRVIVITGANSGLGYETALALAHKGATVVMTARSTSKGDSAREAIQREVPNAQLDLLLLDLASLASIRQFAEDFRARYAHLDVLYNNAGVMAMPHRLTEDGFEMQFGTNHLGHFALTGLLLDRLLATPDSRVVTITSFGHRAGRINFDDLHGEKNYSRYIAYNQSKLANALFTLELQRRLAAASAPTISVGAHPGLSRTNLQTTTVGENDNPVERAIYSIVMPLMSQNQEMGALPQLYAGTGHDVEGGDFYGPMILGMRGLPRKETPSGAARDPQTAARLWEISAEQTGVHYEALQPTTT